MDSHELLKRNFKARDMFYKHRKEMMDRSMSFVLRVTVVMRNSGLLLNALDKNESLYDEKYTGNHIVIFEN